jgi:hypothetical protein
MAKTKKAANVQISGDSAKPAKPRSIKRTLGSMVLAFESFVVFFGTLVAFGLKVADAKTVWTIGLILSAIMIMTPGYLGRRGSYVLGWLLQLVMVVLSFNVPWMPLIALVFASMWAWGMIAGGTIDLARKAMVSTQEANITIDITETATQKESK